MSQISYEICDRCGIKVIRNAPIVIINKLKVVMIFGHSLHGVESEYTLCKDCTRLFVNFIKLPLEDGE